MGFDVHYTGNPWSSYLIMRYFMSAVWNGSKPWWNPLDWTKVSRFEILMKQCIFYTDAYSYVYVYIYIYKHMFKFMDEHQSIPQLVLNLYALEGTVFWLMSRWSKPEIISHVRSANVTWSRVNKIFSDVLRERNHELAIFRSHFHHFLFCIMLSDFSGIFHDFPVHFPPKIGTGQDEDGWELRFDPVVAFLHQAPELEAEVLRITHEQGAMAATWWRSWKNGWNLWISEAGGILSLVT